MSEKIKVGGQAIIEGVMMRSPHSLAISIRRQNGEIVVTERLWESIWDRFKFLKWPFVRGAVVLIEALVNGVQALMFSADQAMLDEERRLAEEEAKKTENTQVAENTEENDSESNSEEMHVEKDETEGMSRWMLIGTIIFSLGFAFALFKGIPHMVTTFVGLSTESFLFHIFDGIIKVSMFVGYVLLISRLPDIKRVFQYHGAEHKSIYAYENGEELIVENAKKYPTLHPRCGTSFIIIVLLSSIFVFMMVFPFFPQFHENAIINGIIQVFIKLPLMLPIAGVSYEFLRWSASHMDNPLVGLLIKPGLWLQHITTSEPDDSQLEIALVSLRKALWREQEGEKSLEDIKTKDMEVYTEFSQISF